MAAHRGGPLLLVILLASALVGCGGGNSSTVTLAPAPTGAFSNGSFNGQYAFAATGVNTSGFFALAGSLQADGNGNIVSGVEDINSAGSVFSSVPITGTYTVGADGRGTAVLNPTTNVFNPITLDFVLVSSQRGLVIRFDTIASASGTLDLQTPSAFSAAALSGQFTFNLSGVDANLGPLQTVGTVSPNGVSSLGTGTLDANDNGSFTSSALTGTYAVGSSNGRGTVTLNTSPFGAVNFVFYIVDANRLKLVGAGSAPVLAGAAYRQQGPFTNATVSGPYAFTVGGGTNTTGPYVAGGVFTTDGNGGISSGVLDSNNNGVIQQNVAFSGNYNVASTGRATLSLNTSAGTMNFAAYPSVQGMQMLETDATLVGLGTAFAQTPASYSAASIQGAYGYNLNGVFTANGARTDAIAQLSGNGSGGFTGALDFNLSGALWRGLSFQGSYTVASNGRGTTTLQNGLGSSMTQQFVLYTVSNSKVLLIEIDAGLVAIASMEHQ
jgi:hypothetical protein